MMHYHGTPLSGPRKNLSLMAGRSFCVSFATPYEVERCHEIGQSVMLDNGAFTFWRSERKPDWPGFYDWCEPWLDYPTTWAVIPDVIDGSAQDNDALIRDWPFGEAGAPVWHLHEPVDRLLTLADVWPRVCIGSSGAYAVVGSTTWHHRMDDAMNQLCGNGPAPVWLHMLRGMSLAGTEYPFASVDSSDVAQNHHRPTNPDPLSMALRWDALQCKPRWTIREQLGLEIA